MVTVIPPGGYYTISATVTATVTLIGQDDLPTDEDPETYTGQSEDWKRRWYEHGRSFREVNLRTASALSEYIWDLKDEGQRYSVSWKII